MRSHLSALRLGSLKVLAHACQRRADPRQRRADVHFTLREVRQASNARPRIARRRCAAPRRDRLARLIALQRALRPPSRPCSRSARRSAAAVAYLEGTRCCGRCLGDLPVAAEGPRRRVLRRRRHPRHPDELCRSDYFKNTWRQAAADLEPLMSRVSGEPIIIFTMPITAPRAKSPASSAASLRLSSRSLLAT